MSKTTRNRYAVLSPLHLDEQRELCIRICNFFSADLNYEHSIALGKQAQKNRPLPLSIIDFLNFYKNIEIDLWPKRMRINELITKLCQKGVLTRQGGVGITESFYFMYELTNLQRLGTLWLGEVLGSQYIGNEIEKDIAYITGETTKGDISVGTGTLISSNIVLTCAHVLTDMTVKEVITVSGRQVNVKKTMSHATVDVGLIILEEDIPRKLPDLAFRDAILLEEVVVAGYPTIPRSLEPVFTLQRGEISGFMQSTMDRCPLDLFSVIARPGNSGGPVVGLDGRIVGIVTRSLERQKEEADSMVFMPFFASIPSAAIRSSVLELTGNSFDIPWEDYS